MIYKLKKIFARRKKIDGLEEVFSEYRFKDFTAKAKFESRFGSRIDFSGLNFLYFGVVLVSAVFLVQVYNLQIVKGEEYAKKK